MKNSYFSRVVTLNSLMNRNEPKRFFYDFLNKLSKRNTADTNFIIFLINAIEIVWKFPNYTALMARRQKYEYTTCCGKMANAEVHSDKK